jgi:hypothetical protein
MDSEKDIEKAAERLAEDNGGSRVKALSVLHSKYQSNKRLEEAVIVRRIIDRIESEANSNSNPGFYDET